MSKIPSADTILKKYLIKYLEAGKDSSEDRQSAIIEAMEENLILGQIEVLEKMQEIPCSNAAFLRGQMKEVVKELKAKLK